METGLKKVGVFIEKTLRIIIKRIFKASLDDEKINTILQFIKFGLVGVSNTLVSYLIYLLCTIIGFHYILSNFLSFTISVLNSFYWNQKYVFKVKENQHRFLLGVFLKTYISYAITGLVLNSFLLYIEVELFNINELAAPLFNLIITIPINYIINKFWAYSDARTK